MNMSNNIPNDSLNSVESFESRGKSLYNLEALLLSRTHRFLLWGIWDTPAKDTISECLTLGRPWLQTLGRQEKAGLISSLGCFG